jgi:hypothetical protein
MATEDLDRILAELNDGLAQFRELIGRMTDEGCAANVTDAELVTAMRAIASRTLELRSLAMESPGEWAEMMAAYRARSPESAALVDEWLRPAWQSAE